MSYVGKMSLHKHRPAYFQQLGNLDGHQPWHCEMLKAGRTVDQVEPLVFLEVGRQMMRIANDIHISSGIVVEPDVLRLRELLSCIRRASHFSAADLENSQTLFIPYLVEMLPPVAMGDHLRHGYVNKVALITEGV